MDIMNVSALLNLTRGYLTFLCPTGVAKLLITATKRTQNALTHGWWAHHRPEADSKPAKEQETLLCRGEAQQEGSGEERIYNIHPWKGEERCEVLPVFINASQQSARGNDQLMETALSLQGEGWGRDGE